MAWSIAPGIVSAVPKSAYAHMCGGGPINFAFAIPLIVGGGGVVPATGIVGSFPNIPFKFTVLGWTIEGQIAGSATFDILSDPYAAGSFPSTSIVGGGTAPSIPALSPTKAANGTTVDWATLTIPANSSLAFNMTAVATFTLFTISLACRRVIGL
jgi:hypothetical protein